MERKPLRVLLIEHDAAFACTVTAMLSQFGETVGEIVTASSLDEGLTQLTQSAFDIVILEFSLPDGAGLANVALLKAQSPRVPLLVLGDSDDETVAVEAMQAGAQDYLTKQISPQWLLRSIRYSVERHQAEVALLEAEEKYRSVFDHLVEGIFQTTPEGRYLMANTTLARIYGYSSPGELMRSVTDIGSKLYVKAGRRDEFVRMMQTSDTITGFESQTYRKDGSVIWISENCRAVRNDEGRLLYYEGTVEDITQRREAQEKLRASESLYHSLVETLPQNVFRKDPLGRFTFANEQYCEHYHCKLEDILGKTDFDFFPAELAEKYRRDDLRVMETGQTLEIVEEHQPLGQKKSIIQVVKTPLLGPDGKVIGLQGIFWDITSQRETQERLRESETLYHSLVETMPQNIFRKDLKGRYTFANPQFCKTLGKSYDEVIGKTIADFLPPDQASLREEDDRKVIQRGKPFETVEKSQFPGSGPIYIQVIKMPIFDAAGKVTGIQGMFWDITQQKMAAERIRKANAELARSREELRIKNLQMQDELKMASEIQVAMLPQQYPVLPRHDASNESAIRFTHRYLPSGEVGGDFFSVSPLSDTEVGVFICDVAGHGVRSALVTAMIRALVEELKPLAADPGQFLTKLNSELRAILQHAGTPLITTAFYLVADAKTGVMRYSNAGHPKPLHIRRDVQAIEPLKNATHQSQPALGIFEKAVYHPSEIRLAPGDLIMLFTDGLYEVHGSNQELYTQDMLTAGVQKRLRHSTPELFDKLLAEIRQFAESHKFDDDVCLVGVELAEKNGGPV
jgi:sigma-B regulation protein RsbU (phosphoserine phosphatase)